MLEVKETFYLNGKELQIISASFHYFRTVPEYWRDRLEKLKNMGCNTIETYIPWNCSFFCDIRRTMEGKRL